MLSELYISFNFDEIICCFYYILTYFKRFWRVPSFALIKCQKLLVATCHYFTIKLTHTGINNF